MKRFPPELEDLLTPRGRRLLAGRDPACGAIAEGRAPFVALPGLVDARKAEACRRLLEARLLPHLTLMEDPIPPETITRMERDYDEWLPKTVRVRTALLESARARSSRVAAELGVTAMLKSASAVALAAALTGRPLRREGGAQVLCYGPGDYSGPHNDHHPEEPDAAGGYVDLHVSLVGPGVAHQWLVYARSGHLSEIVPVHESGTVTAYRLPFWHYTTPLVARPRRAATARRWVLLSTLLFEPITPNCTPRRVATP